MAASNFNSYRAETLAAEISRLSIEADTLGAAYRSGKVPSLSTRRKLEKVIAAKLEAQEKFEKVMEEIEQSA